MKSPSPQQLKNLSYQFQQGRRALQLGAYGEAEKQFKAILKIDPNLTEAQASLAFIYSITKQHSKASALLKLILKSHPNHVQTHLNLANSLFEQELYVESIQHYEFVIKAEPARVDAYINCGIAYRMIKKYELAIARLHSALDLDKVNARAFHVLGMIYVDTDDCERALHCLESAVGIMPSNAEYRVSLANVLKDYHLDLEAGIEYHRACEANPNYINAFVIYGDYLSKAHRFDEALECVKRAEQLDPQNLDVIDQLGEVYLGLSDTDAALSKFNSALSIDPKRLSSLSGIAKTYQETGNAEKGIETCNKMIAIDKTQINSYLLKSRMKKSRVGDGMAEQLLKFIEKSELEAEAKYATYFALGKIFDDQNNFAEAFKYYSLGNDLKNNTLNYSKQSDEAKFSKLIEVFNEELFSDFKHLGVESKLPVIIVGMPRSGTTLTEQIISSHPQVIGAGEVVFWGRSDTAMPLRLGTNTPFPECVVEMNANQASDIAKMYESSLLSIAGGKNNPVHITDKMPHNFLKIGLIALLFPKVKIIHTKRNPIDTCLSIFFQNFNKSHPYASDLDNLGFHYKQYERIMQHWHNLLPGRILDINYEDTISDPEYWSRALIKHIGLEWDDACLAPHKLERSVKTASNWQVRQPIYKTSVQRWRNYEQFLQPLIKSLQ